MTRDQLEHAIRAACDVAGDSELLIFGSQSILGELSPFHETHGFYVQGVSIEVAQLPEGWEGRTHQVKNENTRGNTGYCLEIHDLASSKLAAFRDKDRDFVRVLMIEQMIDADIFLHRVNRLPVSGEIKERSVNWIKKTIKDL